MVRLLGGRGLEPLTSQASKGHISAQGGAESGAHKIQNLTDPDLVLIVQRWVFLPEHIKQAILMLVKGPCKS